MRDGTLGKSGRAVLASASRRQEDTPPNFVCVVNGVGTSPLERHLSLMDPYGNNFHLRSGFESAAVGLQ